MIKGCAKKVVVVRDINSNFFDEAFFIVKAGAQRKSRSGKESDYINEAHRIVKSDLPSCNKVVSESTFKPPYISAYDNKNRKEHKKRVLRDGVMFMFGFGISLVLCAVIYYSEIGL